MHGSAGQTRILVALTGWTLLWAAPAAADIEWTWAYESEAGTLVTDGDLACDEEPLPGSYEIVDFEVTDSLFPENVGSLSGGDYGENQPTQGFEWDGVEPMGWYRASGAFDNGSNFDQVGSGIRYLFADGMYGFDDADVDPGDFIVSSPVIDMAPVIEPCPPPVPPGKTAVCHKGRKTLFVGGRAARAHQRHGDDLGYCE